MATGIEKRVVLVTRHTRLRELVDRYQTLGQARFYLQHLGADWDDYVQEDEAYAASLRTVTATLQAWGRHQVIERSHLSNYVFASDDIVVALGQDGLVANTLKYLDGQPLLGVNPEASRFDGALLPFGPSQLAAALRAVACGKGAMASVTMVEARLSDGQVLRGVNELFIGPRTHTSALYDIEFGGAHEAQSSSGVIVSTGLGSSAWLKSIVAGSMGIAGALGHPQAAHSYEPMPWDTDHLVFAVREPFTSKVSQAHLLYGDIPASQTLKLRSRMPDNGVIFSDGMESDFLRFTAGMEARIGICPTRGLLAQ